MTCPAVGIRWTIGEVSPNGFEALRLFDLGRAENLWTRMPKWQCVCAFDEVEEARRLTGLIPDDVVWREAGDLPDFLQQALDDGMAEGVAWKLLPLSPFPNRYELSLDNDCTL